MAANAGNDNTPSVNNSHSKAAGNEFVTAVDGGVPPKLPVEHLGFETGVTSAILEILATLLA
jgi:hypothetical protein